MTPSPHLDFLIRLKNGYLIGKLVVSAPSSKLIQNLSAILKRFKLIADYQITAKTITVNLSYPNGLPAFTQVLIYSKPGRRWYEKTSSLPWGKTKSSLIIVSTPQGLMSQKEAKKKGLGGEIIAQLY